MCGRYQIVTDAQALCDAFQLEQELEAAPLARRLAPELQDPAQIQTMITPYPDGELQAVPLGRKINNARNRGPELVAPAGAPLE